MSTGQGSLTLKERSGPDGCIAGGCTGQYVLQSPPMSGLGRDSGNPAKGQRFSERTDLAQNSPVLTPLPRSSDLSPQSPALQTLSPWSLQHTRCAPHQPHTVYLLKKVGAESSSPCTPAMGDHKNLRAPKGSWSPICHTARRDQVKLYLSGWYCFVTLAPVYRTWHIQDTRRRW